MDIPSYKIENVLKNYAQNLIKNSRRMSTHQALTSRQRLLSYDGKTREVFNQISEKIINEAKALEAQSLGNGSPGRRSQAEGAEAGAPSRLLISKNQKPLSSIAAASAYQSEAEAISELQDD